MKEKIKKFWDWSREYVIIYFISIIIMCIIFGFIYYNKNTTVEYREIIGVIEDKEYRSYTTYETVTHHNADGTKYYETVEKEHRAYNVSIVAEDYDAIVRFTENNYTAYHYFEKGQKVRVQVAMYYWKGEWQNNVYRIIVQ